MFVFVLVFFLPYVCFALVFFCLMFVFALCIFFSPCVFFFCLVCFFALCLFLSLFSFLALCLFCLMCVCFFPVSPGEGYTERPYNLGKQQGPQQQRPDPPGMYGPAQVRFCAHAMAVLCDERFCAVRFDTLSVQFCIVK